MSVLPACPLSRTVVQKKTLSALPTVKARVGNTSPLFPLHHFKQLTVVMVRGPDLTLSALFTTTSTFCAPVLT